RLSPTHQPHSSGCVAAYPQAVQSAYGADVIENKNIFLERGCRLIPANGLSKVGGDQGTGNAKCCGENEAFKFVRAAGHDELGNHSGNKADKNGSANAEHGLIPLMIAVRPTIS